MAGTWTVLRLTTFLDGLVVGTTAIALHLLGPPPIYPDGTFQFMLQRASITLVHSALLITPPNRIRIAAIANRVGCNVRITQTPPPPPARDTFCDSRPCALCATCCISLCLSLPISQPAPLTCVRVTSPRPPGPPACNGPAHSNQGDRVLKTEPRHQSRPTTRRGRANESHQPANANANANATATATATTTTKLSR